MAECSDPPAGTVRPEIPGAQASESPPPPCLGCGAALKSGAAFCGRCGHRIGAPAPPRKETRWRTRLRIRIDREAGEVFFVLKYYTALLVMHVISAAVAGEGERQFAGLVAGDLLLAGMTAFATLRFRAWVLPLYARTGFGFRGYGVVILTALPVYGFVHLFITGMEGIFYVPRIEMLGAFTGRSFGWAILILCVSPAVLEELAFRGVIFGILERRARLAEAFLISSFAFAILHLSVVSLPTHIVLGLYLCALRWWSRSLYPGMLAHFLHNLVAVLVEKYGWLS